MRTATYDHDALPEPCHAKGHVRGCPGRAGGDHERELKVPHWLPIDVANLERRIKRLLSL